MSLFIRGHARRAAPLLAAVIAATVAALTLSAASASASTLYGTAKAPNGLTVRNGPGAGFTAVGTMAYNQQAPVYCYVAGSSVNGDVYWDLVDVGQNGLTYVSDYWLYTGGSVNTQVENCKTYLSNNTPGIAKESGGLPTYQNPGADPLGISLPYGGYYLVACYSTGPSVGNDNLWDDVVISTSGGVVQFGYVADYWLYTGGDVKQQTRGC